MFDFASEEYGVYPYNLERRRALWAFADHKMTIEHDDGVFRSLVFARPGTSIYKFRICTWPGHLAITGDLNSYVFSRLYDMFEFFSHDNDPASMRLEINADYWAEKLDAAATRSDLRGKAIDVRHIKREVVQAFRELPDSLFASKLELGGAEQMTPEGNRRTERLDAFRDLRLEFLDNLHEDDDEVSVRSALQNLSVSSLYTREYQDQTLIYDPWDMHVASSHYNFGYLLSCYAIVWGIKRYYQAKEGRDTETQMQRILRGEL